MPTIYATMLLVVTVLSGCSTTQKQQTQALPPGSKPLFERIDLGVPDGSITFTGRILEVHTERSQDSLDACAHAPCQALVRIENVSMIGAGGPINIVGGEERLMRFPMTLQPVSYRGKELPGLQINDRFRGVGFEVATRSGMLISVEEYQSP